MRGALERFVEHLENEVRASRHTVRAYRRDVGAFIASVEERHEREPEVGDLNSREVRAHLADLHGSHAPATMSRKLSALRSFGEFLRRGEEIAENELALIAQPRRGKRLPVALPVEDVAQIVEGDHRPGIRGLRDHALMEVIYGAGLRVSEAVALDHDQLRWDGDRAMLRVVHGKGGKDRVVPLGTRGTRALREYLKAKPPRAGRARPQPVFLGNRGRRLSPRSAREIVYRRCLKRGARARIGPHGLRHSFATQPLSSR